MRDTNFKANCVLESITEDAYKRINNFLWCEECSVSHENHCPKHGKLSRIKDKVIHSRAKLTVPYQFSVKVIALRAASKHVYGVFAKKVIQKRTMLGPYEGDFSSQQSQRDDRIRLQLFCHDGTSKYLDCFDEQKCNWMMFVRPAQSLHEQNAVVIQYLEQIYFVTTKVIKSGEELKAWYSRDYGAALGEGQLQEPEKPSTPPPSDAVEQSLKVDTEFLTPPKKRPKAFEELIQGSEAKQPRCKLEALADIALLPDTSNDVQTLLPDTTSQTMFPDMTVQTVLPDTSSGISQVVLPDISGNCQTTLPDMTVETMLPEMTVEAVLPEMTVETVLPDVSSASVSADGVLVMDIVNSHVTTTPQVTPADNEDIALRFDCSPPEEDSFSPGTVQESDTADTQIEEPSNFNDATIICPSCNKTISCEDYNSHLCRGAEDDTDDAVSRLLIIESVGISGSDIQNCFDDTSQDVNETEESVSKIKAGDKEQVERTASVDNRRKRKPYRNEVRRVKPSDVRGSHSNKKTKPSNDIEKEKKSKAKKGVKSRTTRVKSKLVKQNAKLKALMAQESENAQLKQSKQNKLRVQKSVQLIKKKALTGIYKSRGERRSRELGKKNLLKCQHCDKLFDVSSKLEIHTRQHTGEKPFKCSYEGCGKGFVTHFKLKRHETTHGIGSKFQCPYCEKAFGRKDHLKNHLKVHDPDKTMYACKMCKKSYYSTYAFRTHLALHQAEQGSLICYVCKEQLPDKEKLLRHIKVHSGARSIKSDSDKKEECKVCGKKFFLLKDVRRHSVVHTKEKLHMCHLCPLQFGRKDHLVRHLRKTHSASSQDNTTQGSGDQNIAVVKTRRKTATKTKSNSKGRRKKQQSIKKKGGSVRTLSKITPAVQPNLANQSTFILPHTESMHLPIALKDSQFIQSIQPIRQRPVIPGHNPVTAAQAGVDMSNSVLQNVAQFIPVSMHNPTVMEQPQSLQHNVIIEGISDNSQVLSTFLSNTPSSNNLSSDTIRDLINTAGGGVNQVPIMSVPVEQKARENQQFSSQNITTDFEGIHTSPCFPETNLSDIHRILNEGSGIKISPSGGSIKKGKKRRGKKQKSKAMREVTLSKDPTVILKDLATEQMQQNQPSNTQSTSLPNNLVMLQDQVSNSSFQIPSFGSSFDNITFINDNRGKSNKPEQNASGKTTSLLSNLSLLGQGPEQFTSLNNIQISEPEQYEQDTNTAQQSFTIVPINDSSSVYTNPSNGQGVPMLQIVNVSEVPGVNQVVFTTTASSNPAQIVASGNVTMGAHSEMIVQPPVPPTTHPIAHSVHPVPPTRHSVPPAAHAVPSATHPVTPAKHAPPITHHDSEAIKIFFADQQL